MQTHTYPVPFEGYVTANGDIIDGFAIMRATRYEANIVGIEVFAGRNGLVLVQIADHELFSEIKEYLEARPSWLEIADIEHQAYFPAKATRPRLIPAHLE